MERKVKGQFLEKPGLLREAFLREQQLQAQVPGWESIPKKPVSTVSKMEQR